jgi:hypothetical protein
LVALAGVYAASQAVKDWHFVIPAQPGEVLYSAAFAAWPDEWALYDGRLSAQIVEEALHIRVDDAQSLPFSTAPYRFSDFDLRVQTRAVDGPLNNGYGVIFRARDPENFYLFLISSDGYYQVLRAVDGKRKELSTWIPSPLIQQGLGAENTLRIIAQRDTFQFFINGEPVALCIPDSPDALSTYVEGCLGGQMRDQLMDDSFASGQLGLAAMSLDEPGVEVAFDNLIVMGPTS